MKHFFLFAMADRAVSVWVFRGGACDNGAVACRSARRCDETPETQDKYLGLRLALVSGEK